MARLRDQAGFTIVECMVAAAVLLTGVLGTLTMLNTANTRSKTAGQRQAGVALVRDVVEAARQLPYRYIDNDSIVSRLHENGNLTGNGNEEDWKIERGAASFTVEASVCALDDPADGSGAHTADTFCPGGSPAGSVDANPMDYKRVTITASWSDNGRTKTIQESTLVASRGGDLPSVLSLTLTSPASETITSTSVTSASFAAATSVFADAVVWSVDGVQKGSATGNGTAWSFSWTLPPIDGAYDVSAQAFDSSGLSGTTRSLTLTLNRYPPTAPDDFVAGRNGSVVEAEWSANPEPDIIGYRVYKQAEDESVVLACPLTTRNWCIDPSPGSDDDWLKYWVVAVDRDSTGAEREGAISDKVNVNGGDDDDDGGHSAPEPPKEFTLGVDEDGETVLTWQSAGGDHDSYRIYRDGYTVADRYARLDGNDESWTDADTDGTVHQYWITAVSAYLRESPLVGPVSG